MALVSRMVAGAPMNRSISAAVTFWQAITSGSMPAGFCATPSAAQAGAAIASADIVIPMMVRTLSP